MKNNCIYCRGAGPEPGWIETGNNGPIVACPLCNLDGEKDRLWELAEAQRANAKRKP